MTDTNQHEASILSSDSERLKLQCPACEKRMSAPVRLRGSVVECPRCRVSLSVPASNDPPETTAAPKDSAPDADTHEPRPSTEPRNAPTTETRPPRATGPDDKGKSLSPEGELLRVLAATIGVIVVIAAFGTVLDDIKGDWWTRVAEAIVGLVLLCAMALVVAVAVTLGVRIGRRIGR